MFEGQQSPVPWVVCVFVFLFKNEFLLLPNNETTPLPWKIYESGILLKILFWLQNFFFYIICWESQNCVV